MANSAAQRPPYPPTPEHPSNKTPSKSLQVNNEVAKPLVRHGPAQVALPAQEPQAIARPAEGTQVAHDIGRGGAPAVRLDMNLDVDIQMKAKIQGDVTLSILGGGGQRPSSSQHRPNYALAN